MECNHIEDLKIKIIELESRMKQIRLISLINNISSETIILSNKMLYQFITGFEKDSLKFNLPSLFWIFANLCFTLEKNCYFLLYDNGKQFLTNYPHLYEKKKISIEKTYDDSHFEDINVLNIYYGDLIDRIKEWINNPDNNITAREIYLIYNAMHYNSMVNETIVANYKLLKTSIKLVPTLESPMEPENITKELTWHTVIGGFFQQGSKEDFEEFCFNPDNQRPQFKNFVKSFQITDTAVTQGMYLKFVESGGYLNKDLWSLEGWEWKITHKINNPEYWFMKNNIWFKYHFDKIVSIELTHNQPVTNVSWYEAFAFCSWVDGRLPFESEWEFCATNRGNTKFPWGIDLPNLTKNNIDIKNVEESSVFNDQKGNNLYGINGLIGNTWEWCMDSYLPYAYFNMDILNSCITYNNFSEGKKILKGGSIASSKYFITPQYRLGLYPSNRIMTTGFRVVKSV
jgi:gamma-glutamyl hercynylcysteine S-oxide synthase